jgi:hypothetical protein
MEKLFKKYFWLVHVVMVAVVAIMLARTASGVGGHMLNDLLAGETGASKGPRGFGAEPAVTRNFEEASAYNIFKAYREVVNPVDVPVIAGCTTDADCKDGQKCLPVKDAAEGEPSKQCQAELGPGEVDISNAVRSELPLKLVGTSVFSFPEDSLATLVDMGKGRSAEGELFSINDCPAMPPEPVVPPPDPDEEGSVDPVVELALLEAAVRAKRPPCNLLLDKHRLLRIDVDRVYLLNADEQRAEYIALDEPPENVKVAAPRARPKKRPKKTDDKKDGDDDELGAGISKVGPNNYEIKQDEVTKAMANLSKIATKARIVPAFEGGNSIGFKLFSIRPGSVYSKIGIQNGDIVQGVNGYELTSPDKALELYQKLKDGKEFSVDIKRRGQPVTLEYAIVP